MTTEEYLSQIVKYDTMIMNRKLEYERLRTLSESRTVHQKDVDVQTTPEKDKLPNIVFKMMDVEDEVERVWKEFIAKRGRIVAQIEQVENVISYNILFKRYVLDKSWADIADEMNYTTRYVIALHKKALEEFEELYGSQYIEK